MMDILFWGVGKWPVARGIFASCLCTYVLVISPRPLAVIIVIPSILGGQDAHIPENQAGLIDRRVHDERFLVVGGL